MKSEGDRGEQDYIMIVVTNADPLLPIGKMHVVKGGWF